MSNKEVGSGIQFDIMVARKTLPNGTFQDVSFCDHNCRMGTGNYECPAAITLHRGLKRETLASADTILKAIDNTVSAARQANASYLKSDDLDLYFKRFQLPPHIQNRVKETLSNRTVEINLFGGNTERHPGINFLISELKKDGHPVNLTTTGGRFIYDSDFLAEFLKSPPDLLALSADDFEGPQDIISLGSLSLEDIRRRRNGIPFQFGQKRKALEAAYVATLAKTVPNFPQIMFNLVIHPGNIGRIDEIMSALQTTFPGVQINPFPAQHGFNKSDTGFLPEHFPLLERFIDQRINDGDRRVHYWLMLKSICVFFAHDPSQALKTLTGYDSWKCYRSRGANRYIQRGASSEIYSDQRIPGGHLACYWNSNTVTLEGTKVWDMDPGEISAYIARGMIGIAGSKAEPCPGCNFPRLNFDMISLENGMNPQLIPVYLDLRRNRLGY